MNRLIGFLMVLFLSCVFTGVAASETIPNIDVNRTARLSIHKTTSTSDTAAVPLVGVVFRINKVEGIDLTTNDGWGAIAGIDAREIQHQPDKLGPPIETRTALTDAQTATAVFNDLSLGVYLVTEQPARIGDVSYSVTAPFLVALPMNMGSGWEYDVTVQAKNQPISITKTASVEKVAVGEKFTYQLSSTIPAPDSRGQLYRYVIKDALPQGVDYHGMSVRVVGKSTGELRETRDYVVGYHAQRHEVVAQFTEAGLGALARLRQDDTSAHVCTDIHVTVRGNAREKLDNTAVLYPDGYDPDNSGGIPSNKHQLDIVTTSKNGGGGRNNDGGTAAKNPPSASTSGPAGAPSAPTGGGGTEGGASTSNSGVLRIGSLALTGAGIYGMCIAGAIALFTGAALIYYRDKKQRNAKL